MKKFLVVLTILVLVAGFAFADISGKVTAEYSLVSFNSFKQKEASGAFDLNTDAIISYTGSKPTKELTASVTLDKQLGGKTGESLPYVDLAITAEFTRVYEADGYYNHEGNRPSNTFALKIKTFKIVGEEWEVNLLNAKGAKLDLAKSAIDTVTFGKDAVDENTAAVTMNKDIVYANGVSVTYKGFVAGVGFTTVDLNDAKAGIVAEVATPEFVFDNVKVQAGVGFSQKGSTAATVKTEYKEELDNTYYVSVDGEYYPLLKKTTTPVAFALNGEKAVVGSAKVAYEADAVNASVAADFSKSSKENEVKFDVAANVVVAPVAVDVYYGNYVAATDAKDPGSKPASVSAENLLSAKVVFDVAKLAENVPVKVTVTGKDLLNRYDNAKTDKQYIQAIGKNYGKIVDVAVNTTALKNFDITATAGDLLNKTETYAEVEAKYTGIENVELGADVKYTFDSKTLDFDVTAKYTAEKYTVEGELELVTDFESSLLYVDASVESDKLVDGATLKADYTTIVGFDFVDAKKVSSLGSLTLSCTVEF